MSASATAEAEAYRAPEGGVRQALWILVLSLTVLFGAGLVLYGAARTGVLGHTVRGGGPRTALPVWLWFSTFFILASSVALHQALQWARMDLAAQSRKAYRLALSLGYVFVALQIPGLAAFVAAHRVAAPGTSRLWVLVVFLVALHALHVLGGIVPMTAIARRSAVDRATLGNVAVYWHFLAAVWIVMFSVFALV